MCSIAILYLLFNGFYFVSASTECAASFGYVYYPEVDVYYKFYKNPQTWPNARLHCLDENATLAVPKNEIELNIMRRIFKDYPSSMIVGADHIDRVHLGFHDYFGEGDYVTEKEISMAYFYRNFENGQPNGGKNENIISMHRNGQYHDYSATKTAPFICQKEQHSYIDELDKKHKRMKNFDPAYLTSPASGKRFKLHLTPKSWEYARSVCYAEGGHLAFIESKEDETFLVNMMQNPQNKMTYASHNNRYFLGFHDLFNNGQFMTVTGRNINSLKYLNWASGEPSNASGENCGGIFPTGQIHDFYCNDPLVFFCELPPLSQDNED